MQGKFSDNSFLSGLELQKIENLRKIYEWIQQHTELCHLCTDMPEGEEKLKLKEQISESLLHGKELIDDVFQSGFENRKPLIPLSGMNRFTATNEENLVLGKREILASLGNFKAEVTSLSNVKKVPLPSRTYLKKK